MQKLEWKLVPMEATPEMCQAGWDAGKDRAWSYAKCYSAMLAVAPEPPHLSMTKEEAATFQDWRGMDGAMEFAKALVTSAVLSERERWQDVVYDGWKVFGGLDDQAVKRTSHKNVSDVLDALLRVLRSNAVMTGPQAPSPAACYATTHRRET